MNHPELMSYYPVHPVPSVKRWVEQVRTTLKSQTTLYTWFPQSRGGSSRFEGVEPPQTHVKLPCTPRSLSQMVVREGSKELNHPEVGLADIDGPS